MTVSEFSKAEKQWMMEMLNKEADRIRSHGSKVLPLTVNNMSTLLETTAKPVRRVQVINRIECQTQFDFDAVIQLILSDSVEIPGKDGWKYVNVVLFTDKPIPLLVPYVYDSTKKDNTLTHWEFCNSLGHSSRQCIKEFETIH